MDDKKDLKKKMNVKGAVEYDPYIGWIDVHESYKGGYAVLCDLNEMDGYCKDCGHFNDDECDLERLRRIQ